MKNKFATNCEWPVLFLLCLAPVAASGQGPNAQPRTEIGREMAIPAHLRDGEEFNIPLARLVDYGRQLFTAKFTVQEGAGRPMSKGTGAPISDPSVVSNK